MSDYELDRYLDQQDRDHEIFQEGVRIMGCDYDFCKYCETPLDQYEECGCCGAENERLNAMLKKMAGALKPWAEIAEKLDAMDEYEFIEMRLWGRFFFNSSEILAEYEAMKETDEG